MQSVHWAFCSAVTACHQAPCRWQARASVHEMTDSPTDGRQTFAGVSRIMSVMDWGEAAEFLTFGAAGRSQVDSATDVYILVAPQNIVGNTIMTDLSEMVRCSHPQISSAGYCLSMGWASNMAGPPPVPT
jgi:hypothetical protein